MLTLFIGWSSFLVFLLVRYRRRRGVPAEYGHGAVSQSLWPELLVFLFELGLIFLYAIPVWSRLRSDPAGPANEVAVTAEQFAWNIQYPGRDGRLGRRDAGFIDSANVLGLDPEDPAGKDDVVTLNELHAPLGRPTVVTLTSKDVIHSFFIPAFRVKMDAVPGMAVKLWFEPTKTGQFEIGCAQLCGIGHANMRGDVIVHEPAEFEAWLAGQEGSRP